MRNVKKVDWVKEMEKVREAVEKVVKEMPNCEVLPKRN